MIIDGGIKNIKYILLRKYTLYRNQLKIQK